MNSKSTRYTVMRPHIEVKPLPINAVNDDLEYDEETTCLYHVIVSQGKLKMLFLVSQRPKRENPKREFDVVRCEYISLHGLDERDQYLGQVSDISLSADKTIVNEIFEWTLLPYSLKLLSVNFHNFEFFESELEGKGFVFENNKIYDKLKDKINLKCRKMLQNPYIIEY